MNLDLNRANASEYKSNAQIARVLTERWVQLNGYCPNCGQENIDAFENNAPVADFYCTSCSEQFELKSKIAKKVGSKVVDGAYATMIERIQSDSNPHFFFLTYDKTSWKVNNFLIIPKHYFTPSIIEKRTPLKPTARRAGWVGCNINLTSIPDAGRIFLIKNSMVMDKEDVYAKWKTTSFLSQRTGESRSWILDVMRCVDCMPEHTFSLRDMYAFEDELKVKHPNNHFIKDKIRQQLQVLRDKGMITFKGRGIYEKVTT